MRLSWWRGAILLFSVPVTLQAADAPANHPEWDQAYTAKIREFTTAPEFSTDLVDHLPASDKVPTPLAFNGYIAGGAGHLTYAEDVYRYMRALEAASPRVKVFSLGKTEEGREMILVAVADEATIRNLDGAKAVTRQLADPRHLTEQAAQELIHTGKPMYYFTGAMHSVETGSPEMLMELAYRLAVEDTPFIRTIRDNVITLITPVLEVDGRDRMVDLVRYHAAHPQSQFPGLIYWGHYVAHDNNRDAMGLALKLSQNVQSAYFEWHPQVVHDLHESIPFLYISTGTGPYNPALDPIAIDEWHRMAYNETQTLADKGLVGVWTHGFYDGWAPNYMFWVAHGHNSIGRFYETFGNLLPDTEDRVVRNESQRDWYRPNPPYPKLKWSLRDNTNYQESGCLVALKYMADNRQHMLELFWRLGQRSIAKATTEGPAAYVFPGDQKRLGQLRDLLQLLQSEGIEVQQTERAATLAPGWPPRKPEKPAGKADAGKSEVAKDAAKAPPDLPFPAGSFVIRMDQPYSRLADTLLDTQYVLGKEQVYDDTGWTLPYTKNVDCRRIVNGDVLKVPMHLWDGHLPNHDVAAQGAVIALLNHADTDLVRLRYELPETRFAVLEEELKQKSATLPAGTILVAASDHARKAVAAKSSFHVELLDTWPAHIHDLPLPRVAIVHGWINTQEEGWYRLAFDSLGVPYDYISTQVIARSPELRAKYDAIVYPPASGDPAAEVNGLPPGPPVPWRRTPETPNLGVDETDDVRPGLGLQGIQNLAAFVSDGGLLITAGDTAELAVRFGLARYVEITPASKLRAPGTILQAELKDSKSPIGYGYDEKIPIHYSHDLIFAVGSRSAPPARRLSGRGNATDPDVPQGRPFVETPERPKPAPGEEGFQEPENYAELQAIRRPRPEDRPRVILSFPKEADKVLLSGMLEGADELAGTPALIDSPLGKGHILLFAGNPMWRMNTQGSYALVFNAILNAGHLGIGWPPPTAAPAK